MFIQYAISARLPIERALPLKLICIHGKKPKTYGTLQSGSAMSDAEMSSKLHWYWGRGIGIPSEPAEVAGRFFPPTGGSLGFAVVSRVRVEERGAHTAARPPINTNSRYHGSHDNARIPASFAEHQRDSARLCVIATVAREEIQ